jgi:hypothetical protein
MAAAADALFDIDALSGMLNIYLLLLSLLHRKRNYPSKNLAH